MNLLQIRDEAWAASGMAHDRIRKEWDIYHNMEYGENDRLLGKIAPLASRSLNPQIQKGILRLVSPFMEQASRMEIQPDRSDELESDMPFIEDLQNWNTMMEEADNETETLKTLILHNLVSGNAFAKTYFDPRTQIVRSEAVHPLSIAVDGGASRVDLSDAMVVCQKYWQDEDYLRRMYDWRPRGSGSGSHPQRYGGATHRLDELWIRRELAEDCDDFSKEKIEQSDSQMFRAVLIDDELVSATPTPFWWKDFPYAMWRNFTVSFDEQKAQDLFGIGYGSLLEPQQKVVDHFLAALVKLADKIPVGQMIAMKGVLDRQQQHNMDGQVIELTDVATSIKDIEKLPLDQIPPVFAEIIQYITQVMQEMMPSLSEVFTGESPGSGSSGRAINSLQWAAFTQLSANLKAMNEFRRRRVVQRLTGIQQTARKPLSSHIWRGKLDLPNYFPEDARYIGFNVVAADTSSMPQSPQAKLLIAQTFAGLGYIMPLDALLKFTGFDKGYGLTPDMFQQVMQVPPGSAPGGAAPASPADVVSGAESPLP